MTEGRTRAAEEPGPAGAGVGAGRGGPAGPGGPAAAGETARTAPGAGAGVPAGIAPTVDLAAIQEAARTIAGFVHRTPLLGSAAFSELAGADVFLKLENLQKTGSFKVRGAFNRLSRLDAAARARGVICASAGNHAQGVALAGSRLGIPVTVVMPETAPTTKVVATRGYGAEVILHGEGYDGAYDLACRLAEERGLTFIHAFDDPLVVAGQGTVGLEILEDLPDVDTVVVPVGGGGLIAGIAIALKARRPGVRVVGVQPQEAPALARAYVTGRLEPVERARTIADGLAVKTPREMTFRLIRRYVDGMVTVSEEEIARAILLLLERAKLVVEGAGAAALAALLSGKIPEAGRVAVVVSGGNIDVNLLARIIERGLLEDGRLIRIRTLVADRPGSLQALLKVIADQGGNILAVYHDRLRHEVALGEAEVELIIETRDTAHVDAIRRALADHGYTLQGLEVEPARAGGAAGLRGL
ncbi:threonine ammonia-lyase [Thermaerobacter sp. PB12/4term]|uniref:threonine ammonia-lyase n=1 Tax=Thermaerobacter sp. PB12/4term TaxID=2293838 RepID=UPI00193FE961|nr:threonine ammonia-lyase [Thermaerobacter sp. PB12/4term]